VLKHPSNPFWVGEDIQSNMAVGSDVRMWATAISTNAQNGRKIIFRYAKAFDESFDRTSQPIRIIVVWKYQSDTGQPSAEEHERMNVFEDALVTRSVESDPYISLACSQVVRPLKNGSRANRKPARSFAF